MPKANRNNYFLPKISIVIPSLNSSKYIGSTLESIFIQKYPNLEVIIQDGGSSDNTYKIVSKYKKKFKDNIYWESKKDLGQLDAINKGLRKTNGQIITYINADDKYVAGAFEKVAETFINNRDALWFVGRGIMIDDDDQELKSPVYKYFVKRYKNLLLYVNKFNILLSVNYIMQPSVFVSRKGYETFKNFTGEKFSVMEYETWLKLGRISMPIIVNKDLSAFRLRGNNISIMRSKDICKADYNIVKKYTDNIIILLIHRINNNFRLTLSGII